MPLTADAKSIMAKFKERYGAKKGKSVYYATANKEGRSERTFKKAAERSILPLVLKKVAECSAKHKMTKEQEIAKYKTLVKRKAELWKSAVARQAMLRDQLLKQAGIMDQLAALASLGGRGARAAGSGLASAGTDVYQLLKELGGTGVNALLNTAGAVSRHPYSAAGLGAAGLGGYAGSRWAAREPEEEIDPQLAALIAQEQGL